MMPLILALILLVGFCPMAVAGSDWEIWEQNDPESQQRVDHEPWGELLSRFVQKQPDGLHVVRYGAVGSEDRMLLESYLATLQGVDVFGLSRDEQMAFWINLYNAATVRVILDHYPVGSITDIDLEGHDGPWDAKLLDVAGRALSLNEVENQILRRIWSDPRIHYGVNCASYGCPNLALEPYTRDNLDDLLDRGAEDFVNHDRAVRYDGKQLALSSLYTWYQADFGNDTAEVLEHLSEYADDDLADRLESHQGKVVFGYDWSLNDLPVDH